MAYQCINCLHWTANSQSHNCVYDQLDTLKRTFGMALDTIHHRNMQIHDLICTNNINDGVLCSCECSANKADLRALEAFEGAGRNRMGEQ